MQMELSEKEKIRIMNSDDLYQVMRQILLRENKISREQEHFYVVCLNAVNRIINIELISLGAIDETVVKPMQVFRIAIQKGAVKIILCHNHPSGVLIPSPADRDLTDRMAQVGKIIHIEVSDHLIFTLDGFYAFSRKGLMAEIKGSKKYVPLYKEKEMIRKEALRIGKEEGLKEGKQIGLERGLKKGKKEGLKEGEKKGKKIGAEKEKVKIAKKLKKKGIDIEIIAETSGLSKGEIENL